MLVLLSVILQNDGVCIHSDSLVDKIYSIVLHTPSVVCRPVAHQPQKLYLYTIQREVRVLAETCNVTMCGQFGFSSAILT